MIIFKEELFILREIVLFGRLASFENHFFRSCDKRHKIAAAIHISAVASLEFILVILVKLRIQTSTFDPYQAGQKVELNQVDNLLCDSDAIPASDFIRKVHEHVHQSLKTDV